MYYQNYQQYPAPQPVPGVNNPNAFVPSDYNNGGLITNVPNNQQLNQGSQPLQNANVPAVLLTTELLKYLAEKDIDMKYFAVENARITAEKEKLLYQLNLKQFREEAYTKIHISMGYTYSPGKNGVFQLLMETTVKEAYKCFVESPTGCTTFFMVKMDGYDCIYLSEAEYYSTQRLLSSLRQSGITVHALRSPRNTAELVRMSIEREMKDLSFPFYAGWKANAEKTESAYLLFSYFATCRYKDQIERPSLLSEQSPAITATAISQFLPVFEMIRTSFKRQLTLLLYHEAAIHTLLQQLGYTFPLAICFFSTEHNILSYFRKLLSWFNTSPIILDTLTNNFSCDLLARKDQPLLVEDSGRLNQAAKNSKILESALLNHVVPWKNKRETWSLPLQAPITLLSSRASALSCAPEVMVLDFVADDFDREVWKESADQVGQNRDYLTAFCGYTSTHIPELKDALAEGQRAARHLDEGQLIDPCLQTLGIFIGLRNFLGSFFKYAALNSMPFPSQDGELKGQLVDLLVQTSEKAERASLPEKFIDIARNMIQKDILHIHHRNRCPVDMRGVVAFDEDRLHFTFDAFSKVCQSMMKSRPVIEATLSQAGMFSGARINQTTPQTRITTWNEYGIREVTPVFSFAREVFDIFGDPLILEEEDVQ